MKTLTDQILAAADAEALNAAFLAGVNTSWERTNGDRRAAQGIWRMIRERHDLKNTPPLLTPPSANMKLAKGAQRPAYGLTLQHHSVKLSTNRRVNACPWAGHCVKVCVLDNGNGMYPKVQRARVARTEFLARYPHSFVYLLGHELGQAVAQHDQGIDFRPNVNSDVEWERIVPAMLDGTIGGVWAYGYTKNPAVLDTDGWVLPRYRVAFSANERLGLESEAVGDFLRRGGSVAVVTDRAKGVSPEQWAHPAEVLDADATDEWIWESGVVGDLTAKGKARKLIGRSRFIAQV